MYVHVYPLQQGVDEQPALYPAHALHVPLEHTYPLQHCEVDEQVCALVRQLMQVFAPPVVAVPQTSLPQQSPLVVQANP